MRWLLTGLPVARLRCAGAVHRAVPRLPLHSVAASRQGHAPGAHRASPRQRGRRRRQSRLLVATLRRSHRPQSVARSWRLHCDDGEIQYQMISADAPALGVVQAKQIEQTRQSGNERADDASTQGKIGGDRPTSIACRQKQSHRSAKKPRGQWVWSPASDEQGGRLR